MNAIENKSGKKGITGLFYYVFHVVARLLLMSHALKFFVCAFFLVCCFSFLLVVNIYDAALAFITRVRAHIHTHKNETVGKQIQIVQFSTTTTKKKIQHLMKENIKQSAASCLCIYTFLSVRSHYIDLSSV